MSNIMTVHELEELKSLLNENDVLEIVVRGAKKRIKAFQKVAISDLAQKEEKEAAQKVAELLSKNIEIGEKSIGLLNKNISINSRSLELISQVAGLSKVGVLIGGLNLCATCVGFAVIYCELQKMESAIASQINQLQKAIKQSNDIKTSYEFNKVLSEHNNMLDCRRKRHPYTEDQMRKLVDAEYNVLKLLIQVFLNEIGENNEDLIFSIVSLSSMLSASLRYFDEIYYFNNRQELENDNPWHSSHEEWMSVYDLLLSKQFVEKLQDYAMFETKMNTQQVDAFYIGLKEQVLDLSQQVRENQTIIVRIDNLENLQKIREATIQEVKDTIEANYKGVFDETESQEIYSNALKQAVAA